jgi:molecular chaperone GrpE (heat shock protein)
MAQKKTPAKKTPAKKTPAKKAGAKKQAAKKTPAKKAAAKKKAAPKKPEIVETVAESISDTQWAAIEAELNEFAQRAEAELSKNKSGFIKKLISWVRS